MKRTLAFICLSVALSLGCGRQTIEKAVELRGQLDSTLSSEDQNKQAALGRLLRAFQEGANDPSDLEILAGDIQFADTIEAFFGLRKRLYRWEYKGSPVGDEFGVVLVLDEKQAGPLDSTTEVREERIYSVSLYDGQYQIQRTR